MGGRGIAKRYPRGGFFWATASLCPSHPCVADNRLGTTEFRKTQPSQSQCESKIPDKAGIASRQIGCRAKPPVADRGKSLPRPVPLEYGLTTTRDSHRFPLRPLHPSAHPTATFSPSPLPRITESDRGFKWSITCPRRSISPL